MHEEAVQLVKGSPRAPPSGQRVHLLVALQDPVEVRSTEERQQCEVGLTMPAVRSASRASPGSVS